MSRLQDLIMRLAEKKGLGMRDSDSDSDDDDDDDDRSSDAEAADPVNADRNGTDGRLGNLPGTQAKADASASIYGSKDYWDGRYEDGVIGHTAEKGVLSNEWYLAYAALKDGINRYVSRCSRVLILGSGLSTLGSDMERDGYSDVTCVDYSPVCIERMCELAEKERSAVTYKVMDVTQLEWEDETWDCVLDKATLDSLMNDEGCASVVPQMLSEAVRVLRHGGRYVCISHSNRCDDLRLRPQTPLGGDDGCGGSGNGRCEPLPWVLETEEILSKNKARFWMGVLRKS